VIEAHGKSHDLEPLAPASEDHDRLRLRDHADGCVDGAVIETVKDPAEFGESGPIKRIHHSSLPDAR
jgi:hypothetical protein